MPTADRRLIAADGLPTGEVDQRCETTPTGTDDTGILCLVAPAIMDELSGCVRAGAVCEDADRCMEVVIEARGVRF